MPCLFTSATSAIDIYWLSEAILLCPDGPSVKPEVELQLNGLVQPRCDSAKLTFVHRGEIYDIRERSEEWGSAAQSVAADWFCDRILSNPELANSRWVRPSGPGQVHIRPRHDLPAVMATVSAQKKLLPNINVYGVNKDLVRPNARTTDWQPVERPLFSTFEMEFDGGRMQLFRLSFRTTFGLRDYGMQVGVEAEGPDLAIHNIRTDISRSVESSARRLELRRRIDELYDSRLQPPYEIAIIGHPLIPFSVVDRVEADMPILFALESKGTPIRSAASPTRVEFFERAERKFFMRILMQFPGRVTSPGYSEEFVTALEQLNDRRRAGNL